MESILTLTEIIFRGRISKIDLKFLKVLLTQSCQVRFNSPEITNNDYNFIVDLMGKAKYVDLAFDSVTLNMASNVYANLILINKEMELLFFFDLKDIKSETNKEAVDIMIVWAKEFGSTYRFDTFICQVDNANEDEFYFKDDEYGPLYEKLI